MEVCDNSRQSLPKLSLDRPIPSSVLARRGAISFSSSTGYTLPRNEGVCYPCASCSNHMEKRRGGVSFERTDKNALYVRMLGDVKLRSRPDLGSSTSSRERRRSSALDSDFKILENLQLNEYRTRCGLRFLSLHKPKRRRRPILRSSENASILDEHYNGQAKRLLATFGDWDFNIFSLDKLTNGRALFFVGLHVFQEHNLIQHFKLDIVKLMKCLTLIEEGYHSNNPYHNAVHAADVTQAMHCYLEEAKLGRHVKPLEAMMALLSAVTHDLDHPGVNQAFLIATSNHLAALYKNSSVLEHHHWRSAIGVLHESGVFSHLDAETWASVEWQLKSLILATDITRQQEFLSSFKKHNDISDLSLQNPEQRHFILQIALKCADICNPCRKWDMSKKWSERVCEEFFQQGDYERKLQIPVTPLCDRYATTVAKIQAGFMQFVVGPLFVEWDRFLDTPLCKKMLDNVSMNKTTWQEIQREADAELDCSQDEEMEEEKSDEDKENLPQIAESEGGLCSESGSSGEDPGELAPMLEPRYDLSPVEEDISYGVGTRRHSMPPSVSRRDITKLHTHRDILRTEYSRRNSLPTKAASYITTTTTTSAERFNRDFAYRTSLLEAIITRPRITTLTSSVAASRLTSHLSGEENSNSKLLINTSTSSQNRTNNNNTTTANRITSVPCSFLPSETENRRSSSSSSRTFQTKPVLANLSSHGNAQNKSATSNSNNKRESIKPLDSNTRFPPMGLNLGRRASCTESTQTCDGLQVDIISNLPYVRPRSLSLDVERLLPDSKAPKRKSFSGESALFQSEISTFISTSSCEAATMTMHSSTESLLMRTTRNPVSKDLRPSKTRRNSTENV